MALFTIFQAVLAEKPQTLVFGGVAFTCSIMRFNLQDTRKRLARKLNNPRLLKVTFHSLGHWKATMEYHKTKDILHVKELLGHRTIKSIVIYIHIIKALFLEGKPEEFHVKVAKTPEGIKALLEWALNTYVRKTA